MKIDKVFNGNNLTITIDGRLDTNTAPELEKEVETLEGVQNLILDFKNLDYISSAGLRIVLALQKTMNNKGSMTIKNVKDEIKEIFEMTGFSDILTIE